MHRNPLKKNISDLLVLIHQAEALQLTDMDDPTDAYILALLQEAAAVAHETFDMVEEIVEEEDEDDLDEDSDDREGSDASESYENPRGAWTDKDERKYQHIKQSVLDYGGSMPEAKRIAAATVNRDRSSRKRR